ncbi:MAG: chain-length determining protein [Gammaproteobacteria bacterium]|nr:chain-length determining protein [Gammaproteobacteria bacterium]
MSNTPQPTQHSYDSDEIDLFELAHTLWQEKILIIMVTAVITVLTVVYALTVTPIYEVKSIIKPAATKDLHELNGLDIYSLSPEEALTQVGASLESYETRFEYFKENQNLFEPLVSENKSLQQSFQIINDKNIKVFKPDPKSNNFSNYVGIQIEYPKGIDGAAIANGFIKHAIELEKQRIASSLEVVIDNQLATLVRKISTARAGYVASKEAKIAQLKENDTLKKAKLNDELAALRETLKERRQNRIAELDEAISIAKSLGIKKPTTPSLMANEVRSSSNVVRTEVNSNKNPLYFMGTDALTAQRDALLARESDDFTSGRIVDIKAELKLLENNRQIEVLETRENEDLFLAELAENRKEISRLKNLKIDMDKLRLVRIDQTAVEATSPIKPKKLLIVALGVVIGGMLGVFAALIRGMIRKRKAQDL